jgi:hypothetical protein
MLGVEQLAQKAKSRQKLDLKTREIDSMNLIMLAKV